VVQGLGLIEVLVMVLAGLVVLQIVLTAARAAGRIRAGGEDRMTGAVASELTFRRLAGDLAAAADRPHLSADRSGLVISRHRPAATRGPGGVETVLWEFRATPGGAGSSIVRRTGGGEDPLVLCSGLVTAVAVDRAGSAEHPALVVRLVLDAAGAGAVYTETFFLENLVRDRYWNPIDPGG
jgi:hypothetical protein